MTTVKSAKTICLYYQGSQNFHLFSIYFKVSQPKRSLPSKSQTLRTVEVNIYTHTYNLHTPEFFSAILFVCASVYFSFFLFNGNGFATVLSLSGFVLEIKFLSYKSENIKTASHLDLWKESVILSSSPKDHILKGTFNQVLSKHQMGIL